MTTTAVKERPILFSGEMVRAILDGKSQTRRIMKPQPVITVDERRPSGCHSLEIEWNGTNYRSFGGRAVPRESLVEHNFGSRGAITEECPYGRPGDRLWVRETWTELLHTSPATDEPLLCDGDKLIEHATRRKDGGWHYDGKVIAYRATSTVEFCDGDGFSGDMANRDDMPRWRPSIHMPRWASRITLELTDVRVERVQDISEADAMAEGCVRPVIGCARDEFYALWNRVNGDGAWERNDWVWVLCFRRLP